MSSQLQSAYVASSSAMFERSIVPEAIRRANELTPYAVLARFPGGVGPVTERDHERVLEIAEAVIRRVEEQL